MASPYKMEPKIGLNHGGYLDLINLVQAAMTSEQARAAFLERFEQLS